MASILRRLRADEQRSVWPQVSYQALIDAMVFQGHQYGFQGSMNGSRPDQPDPHFRGFVQGIHKRNGVVSAAVIARALLLSQLRFVWRNNRLSPTPGRMFGTAALSPLERPGTMTRPELLFRLELDASYAGNAYAVRNGNTISKLRPDYVTVILGSDTDPSWDGDVMLPPSDAQEIAIMYQPEAAGKKGRPEIFVAGEYFHWMPEPDPVDFWRGASWVTSVLREVATDGQVMDHQSKFFENAATPNLVFVMDPALTSEQVKAFADLTNEKHAGVANAYKNMFLGGGADVKVVGSTISDLSLRDLSGGFEARIASRSRVPAVVLGIREGMAGSALNSGNYAQTRRLWADGWFSPTAQNLCAAVESILPAPFDAELWYDSSEVLFLQEDQKDAAEIAQTNAQAVRSLVEAGYDPASVVDAVKSGDLGKLQHTGVFSVQLQPPGSGQAPARSLDERSVPALPAPTVNVYPTVEQPNIQIDNHMPEREVLPAPQVNVMVEPTPVSVAAPNVTVEAPNVTVENLVPVPNVTVEPTVTTPVTVEPAQVIIMDPPKTRRVVRDNQGNITKVVDE